VQNGIGGWKRQLANSMPYCFSVFVALSLSLDNRPCRFEYDMLISGRQLIENIFPHRLLLIFPKCLLLIFTEQNIFLS